jgi:hypothetical protein
VSWFSSSAPGTAPQSKYSCVAAATAGVMTRATQFPYGTAAVSLLAGPLQFMPRSLKYWTVVLAAKKDCTRCRLPLPSSQ